MCGASRLLGVEVAPWINARLVTEDDCVWSVSRTVLDAQRPKEDKRAFFGGVILLWVGLCVYEYLLACTEREEEKQKI
jgi:hypothetical protein